MSESAEVLVDWPGSRFSRCDIPVENETELPVHRSVWVGVSGWKVHVSKYLAVNWKVSSGFQSVDSCYSSLSSYKNFRHVELDNRSAVTLEEISHFFAVEYIQRVNERFVQVL
jgi:hypothetical protein